MNAWFSMRATTPSASPHRQYPAVPRHWLPGAEHFERIADHGGLVAQHRFAEFCLQANRDRLGDPGTAADIDCVAIRMITKRLAPEVIGKPHVVAGRNLVEVVRVQGFGRAADHLDA